MKRAVLLVVLAAGHTACAQSLFQRMVDEPAAPGSSGVLRATSMYLVDPPEPRVYRTHDIVYVIINENSRASSSQSMDTNKEVALEDRLNAVLDPWELLELRLKGADLTALDLLDLESKHEFKGDGKYDRNDQLTARLAAEVIDVKPNGNIVIQAKKSIGTDGERKVMVLSGLARQEDITDANTILSSQLADLRIDVQHEGELRKSSEKGLITRVLETIFNF